MDDSSQLYCTEPPLNMGVWSTPAMRGGSQQHNIEPAKLSSTTIPMSDPLSSAFHATESYMGFQQQYDHQVGNSPWVSQFPTYDSHVLSSQSSAKDNCSTDSADEQAGSNYDFRDSLQSLVKSHLCNNRGYCSYSSSESNVPSNSSKLPHDQNMLLGENAAFVIRKQLSLPSHANQALNVID
uniref:Uncharacterized protein n=1 Tax=Fagus sylvatica TaxID=28930 RepID=A0A2N9EWJ2_FAGSY